MRGSLGERLDKIMEMMLAGEPASAFTALKDPLALSPTERRTLGERMGLEPPFRQLLDITTNPLVLAGLLMTVVFRLPLPGPGRLFGTMGLHAKDVVRLKHLAGPLEWIKSLPQIYKDTRLTNIMQATNNLFKDLQSSYWKPIKQGTDKVIKGPGKSVTREELWQSAAALDDLGDPGSRSIAGLKERLSTWIAKHRPEGVASAAPILGKPWAARAANPRMGQLAKDTRVSFDEIVAPMREEPAVGRLASSELHKIMGFSEAATEGGFAYRGGYWPRFPTQFAYEEMRLNAQRASGYIEGAMSSKGETLRSIWRSGDVARQASPHMAKRFDRMVPDPEALRGIGFPEDAVKLVQGVIDESAEMAKQMVTAGKSVAEVRAVQVLPYSLEYAPVVEKYIHQMAKMRTWAMPPDLVKKGGRWISEGVGKPGEFTPPLGLQTIDELVRLKKVPAPPGIKGPSAESVRADIFAKEWLPIALETMEPAQAARNLRWFSMKQWAVDNITKVIPFKGMSKKLRGSMLGWIADDRMSSHTRLSGEAAAYFYGATLGAHAVPPLLNLTQTFVTLGPLIGYRNVFRGHAMALRDSGKYLSMRAGATSHKVAFEKAFPRLRKLHLELDPTVMGFETELRQITATELRGGPGKWVRGIRDAVLKPFQLSETYNRIAAFYGSARYAEKMLPGRKWLLAKYGKAITAKPGGPFWEEIVTDAAQQLVMKTQFGAGFMNTPQGLLRWNPLARQFMQFPTRMAALTLGEVLPSGGALGRWFLGGGLAYEVGKELFDTDLSRVLLLGPLPAPTEGLPFAPFPVVPPAAQLIGAPLQALAKGEWAPIQKMLPLLVPGGVGLSKMAPMMPGVGKPAGRMLNRQYADYKNPITGQDGHPRYPVYTTRDNLVGYYTWPQLFMRSLGLPTPTTRQEQILMQYMLKQRDRIREMKRDYLTALVEGDSGEALRLQEEYQRVYPALGPLPIRKSDIRAVHLRRDVARMERTMETLPPEVRERFRQTAAISMGANLPDLLGLHGAGLLEGRTITSRDSWRARPRPEIERILKQGFHQMKLKERMEALGIPNEPGQEQRGQQQAERALGLNY